LREGFRRDQIALRQIAYIRFYGQLEDVEVESPVPRLSSAADVDALLARFEELFAKMFTLAGKPPTPTYLVTEVSAVAQVDTIKPKIVRYDLEGPQPPRRASKGTRPVFHQGRWQTAALYEMDELRAGNRVPGLAVIEAPNTTLFVPSGWQVEIDEYRIFWLRKREES
jgi:N-methylhydantoinase A/oxoprolinase/acetone carboxylase beta subunit